jgi:hypothetical protein
MNTMIVYIIVFILFYSGSTFKSLVKWKHGFNRIFCENISSSSFDKLVKLLKKEKAIVDTKIKEGEDLRYPLKNTLTITEELDRLMVLHKKLDMLDYIKNPDIDIKDKVCYFENNKWVFYVLNKTNPLSTDYNEIIKEISLWNKKSE